MAKTMAVQQKDARQGPAPPAEAKSRESLIRRLAARFHVDDDKMLTTLKQTAFRAVGKDGRPIEVTNEQMMALLVVADQYHLNPWTKEIYAFPDRAGGIVPVVGVDGWIRMINEHPQFKSIELRMAETDDPAEILAWIECEIWRKDRDRPIVVREFFIECKRNTDPWNQMPRRMLRHKAIIQCGRVAFGFSGVYDPDDAEYMATVIDVTPRKTKPAIAAPAAMGERGVEEALILPEQLAELRKQLGDNGIAENEACEQFQVDVLEALLFDQVPEVLAWIKRCNAP